MNVTGDGVAVGDMVDWRVLEVGFGVKLGAVARLVVAFALLLTSPRIAEYGLIFETCRLAASSGARRVMSTSRS